MKPSTFASIVRLLCYMAIPFLFPGSVSESWWRCLIAMALLFLMDIFSYLEVRWKDVERANGVNFR